MKHFSDQAGRLGGHGTKAASTFLVLILAWTIGPVCGGVPEPDNLVYGSISLDGEAVISSSTEVVVEARRSSDGTILASYRMGSDPRVGDLYSIAIPLQSGPGPIPMDASQSGEDLFIVVMDGSGDRALKNYSVGERGEVVRLDFGSTVIDGDGNGLPDVWEVTQLGASGQDPDSVRPNGFTTFENFEAGLDPKSSSSRFQVTAELQGEVRVVSFLARAAQGPGYDGYTRYYTLEQCKDSDLTIWTDVPGFVDIIGANQTPAYQTPRVGPPVFYRGRVRLVGP